MAATPAGGGAAIRLLVWVLNEATLARAAVRVGAVGTGAASGFHVVVANEPALATAPASFGPTAGLQISIPNKPTMARASAADGAAIGLAVRVLNKAAVALLGMNCGGG